jgi:hypothetical protein
MRLGIENREQVYLLAGLAVVAGYLVFVTLRASRPPAPSAPIQTPAHPGARHSTGKSQPLHPVLMWGRLVACSRFSIGLGGTTTEAPRRVKNPPQVENLPHIRLGAVS